MAANSLRPQVVRVMAAHRERPFTTEEIYEQVAASGVPGFDPTAKRDRNLVNRELSDLAGCSAGSHSKPSPQLLVRVSRGRYIFNEINRPMDLALVQEYLEPQEVYEKRPPRRRGEVSRRETVPDSVRMALYAVQHGVCPGCGFYQPHYLRFDVDHIVALADDGRTERRNLQLLCTYCNRLKGNGDGHGYRLKMAELRTHNARTGVMVDEKLAVLTGKRLAQHHRGDSGAQPDRHSQGGMLSDEDVR